MSKQRRLSRDIVDRLSNAYNEPIPGILHEAAAEIARLRAERDRLREALANMASAFGAKHKQLIDASADAGNGWRPISEAPLDGTEFLAHMLGNTYNVVFHDGCSSNPWQTPDGVAYHRDAPTHWMPLPPPPAAPEKGGE